MAFDAFLGYLLDENKELISVQDLVTYPMPAMFSADDNAEAGQSEFAYERLHQSMQNFAYDYHRRTQDPRIQAEMKETGWHDRRSPSALPRRRSSVTLRSRPRRVSLRSRTLLGHINTQHLVFRHTLRLYM